jgi:hypothetical protein
MKLFSLLGKQKPVSFPQFRDVVRLAVRRHDSSLRIQDTENGFILTSDQLPIACNLRNLYAAYSSAPGSRDALIKEWLNSLVMTPPIQGWHEARPILRPMLKDGEYLAYARQQMLKSPDPDSLPSRLFAGELSVIVVRDLPGTAVAVTQKQLEEWGVTFEQARDEALSNMGLLNFPPIVNTLLAGGSSSRNLADQPAVGLVFQGDHLTATWLMLERFRDYVGQRLHGDYVVFVPNRSRLIAIRADEPGLITTTKQANRSYRNQAHALTGQCYYVSAATTGGVVSVHQEVRLEDSLPPTGRLNPGDLPPHLQTQMPPQTAPEVGLGTAPHPKPAARPLNEWWILNEPTDSEE